MGYLTYHTMSIENATEEDRRKIVKFLDDLGVIGYALDENLDGAYPVTWYDEQEQMEQASLAFPHVHFTVHGEGDNNGDIWDHHYLNGMFQEIQAQIVTPPHSTQTVGRKASMCKNIKQGIKASQTLSQRISLL